MATRAITLTLSVRDADSVLRALERIGPAGEEAIRKLDAAAKKAAGNGGLKPLAEGSDKVTGSLKLQAHEWNNLSFQIQDFLVQVGSGQGVFRPLLQQAPQAVGAVGGVSNAIALVRAGLTPLRVAMGATAVAAGVMTVAFNSAEGETARLGSRLRGLSEDYQALARVAAATSRQIARAGVGIAVGDAEAAQVTLRRAAAGSQIGGLDFASLTIAAADLAAVIGGDLASNVGKLASAMRDPVALIDELARQGFPSMNEATRLAAQRLSEAGERGEAFALVMRGIRADTANAAREGMSPLGKAAEEVKVQFGLLWDDVKGDIATTGEAVLSWLGSVVQKLREMRSGRDSIFDPSIGNSNGLSRWLNSGTPTPSAGQPDAQAIQRMIREEAERQGVPVDYALRIARGESNFRQFDAQGNVLNNDGALGVFQMRSAARLEAARALGLSGAPHLTAEGNIRMGVWYAGQRLAAAGGNELEAAGRYYQGDAGYARAAAGQDPSAAFAIRQYQQRFSQPLTITSPAVTVETPAGGAQRPGLDMSGADLERSARDALSLPGELDRALKIARGAISVSGKTQEARTSSMEGLVRDLDAGIRQAFTPAQLDELTQKRRELTGEIERSIDPQERMIRQAREYADQATALSPIQAQLTAKMVEYDRSLKEQGRTPDPAKRAEYLAETLRGLSAPYNQAIRETQAQSAAQDRLSEAWGEGREAVQRLAAQEKAREVVKATTIGSLAQQRVAVEKLAAEYQELTQKQTDNAQRQSNDNARRNIEYLEKERSLVSATADARERELAAFRARQQAAPGTSENLIQEAEGLARRSADISRETQQIRNSWEAIPNFVEETASTIRTSLVSALASGETRAIRLSNILRAAGASFVGKAIDLAVINPALNAVFGGTRGTLGGIGAAAAGGGDASAIGSIGTLSRLGGLGRTFSGAQAVNTGWGWLDSGLNSTAYTISGSAENAAAIAAIQDSGMVVGNGVTAGANVSYAQAGMGALGVLGGAYGVYQGFQTGGARGWAQGTAGAAGIAGGAATLMGGAGAGGLIAGVATVAPYVAVAALVASMLLSGQKPSDKTGTYQSDLLAGTDQVGGFVGSKFSQDNRDAARGIGEQINSIAEQLRTSLGVDRTPFEYTVAVGNRDGVSAYYNGGRLRYERDDEGVQQLIAEITMAMVDSMKGLASAEIQAVINSSGGDTTSTLQNLDWYNTTYQQAIKAPDAETMSALALAQRALADTYDDLREKATSLGLTTDALNRRQAELDAELIAQRDKALSDANLGLDVRMLRATGRGAEADLMAFDFAAAQQTEAWKEQLRQWGISGQQLTDEIAKLAQTIGAEREDLVNQSRQATIQSARGLLEEMTFGRYSALSEREQYAASQMSYGAARDAYLRNDTAENWQELERIARTALEISGSYNGMTSLSYASLQQDFRDLIRERVPEADSAGIGDLLGVSREGVDLQWQQLDVLTSLRDEMEEMTAQLARQADNQARLAAQNEAMARRLAALT